MPRCGASAPQGSASPGPIPDNSVQKNWGWYLSSTWFLLLCRADSLGFRLLLSLARAPFFESCFICFTPGNHWYLKPSLWPCGHMWLHPLPCWGSGPAMSFALATQGATLEAFRKAVFSRLSSWLLKSTWQWAWRKQIQGSHWECERRQGSCCWTPGFSVHVASQFS